MVNASYPPVSSSSTPVSDIDLYSDEVLADPYPAFRVIRDTGPAVQLTAYPVWVIARYADVRAALRDWRTFTSAEGVAMTDEMNAHMRGSVLASDPPEHGVLRGVLSEKLAPRALAKLSDEVGGRADAVVAEAVSKGTFDAVTDLCARLPLEAVADLIGLPPEGRERLLPGSDAVFATFGPLDARMQARMPTFQSYFEYMMSFSDPSKLAPGSWGAAIWDAVDDGRIGPGSAFPLLTAYLVAALDTTVYALGSYVQFLAEAPQRWSALKADPGLIGSGSTALPDPDRFDLHRNPVDHLAFGYGIHSCTGQGLARIETQALFGLLLRRAGSIQLAGQPVRHVHPTLRGLERLPVTVASA